MADYMAAEITVGGALTPDTLHLLSEIFEKDYYLPVLILDDKGEETGVATFPLVAEEINGTFLFFQNDQARYGEFPSLEKFLTENEVSFDRHTAAKYEYDAERVWFREGMGSPMIRYETPSGGIGISETVLDKIVNVLENPTASVDHKALIAELRCEYPVSLAQLTPISIVKV